MLGLVDSFSDKWLARFYAPLLADLFLYSYENEFLDKLIKEGKRKLARKFNLSYRYIDDDLISFNNKRFKDFISDMYPQNSQFLKPQNLLQLLTSICFSPKIKATI